MNYYFSNEHVLSLTIQKTLRIDQWQTSGS